MRQQESAVLPEDLQLLSIPLFGKRAGGLNYFTVTKWIAAGRLKSVKVGKRRLIPLSELRRVCSGGLDAK